jgi:hypothetical protein
MTMTGLGFMNNIGNKKMNQQTKEETKRGLDRGTVTRFFKNIKDNAVKN